MTSVDCVRCAVKIPSHSKHCQHCGMLQPGKNGGDYVIAFSALLGAFAFIYVVAARSPAYSPATPTDSVDQPQSLASTAAPEAPALGDDLSKLVSFHQRLIKCEHRFDALVRKANVDYADLVSAYEAWEAAKISLIPLMFAGPKGEDECPAEPPIFARADLREHLEGASRIFHWRVQVQELICTQVMRSIDIGVMLPSQSVTIRRQRKMIKESVREMRETLEKAYAVLEVDTQMVDWEKGGLLPHDVD